MAKIQNVRYAFYCVHITCSIIKEKNPKLNHCKWGTICTDC